MASTAPKKACSPEREATLTRRRCEILEKAIQLFAAHGYAGTDTQLLADELQVGKGTLYRYFENKEELFLAAADFVLQQMQDRIDAAQHATDDPLDQLRKVILAYLTFFSDHPEYVEMMIQERALFKDRGETAYFRHRQRHGERWRDVYRRLMADGRVRPMPPERITNVMGDLLYGAMCANFFIRRPQSPAEQVETMLDVVWNGILSESERDKQTAAMA